MASQSQNAIVFFVSVTQTGSTNITHLRSISVSAVDLNKEEFLAASDRHRSQLFATPMMKTPRRRYISTRRAMIRTPTPSKAGWHL